MSDGSARLEGPLPPAALDDPHLAALRQAPRGGPGGGGPGHDRRVPRLRRLRRRLLDRRIAQWEAATLGVGLVALGFGVTAWGKYLMPQGPFVEERHDVPLDREPSGRP